MKTQIIALLLAVFLATVNAFGVPTQMALGGVNGGKIHKSDLSRIKSFITWNGTLYDTSVHCRISLVSYLVTR